MSKSQKKSLITIIISAVLFVAALLIPSEGYLNGYLSLIIFLVPYLIAGFTVLRKAFFNIIGGQIFDENFLMCIASIGAFAIGEFSEGVVVMIFYRIGELFESMAVEKSRKSVTALMDICPDYANIEKDNQIIKVAPEEVNPGDIIVVKPGEKIPLDGIITEGESSINTSALTGESIPRDVSAGDSVISGCINFSGLLRIKVTSNFSESTVSKILELVENASSKKSSSEKFITHFAKYYTPSVVIAAVILAILPPLILHQSFTSWINRALNFLVVSCPCALVISVPLSFFGGIGGASKRGILVKGSNYLEALAKAQTIVFDKTGTLTKGNFKVSAVHKHTKDGDKTIVSEEQILEYAAIAESYSSHPISLSIVNEYGKSIDKSRIQDVKEIAGQGIQAVIDGKNVYVGNHKLMESCGAEYHNCHRHGTIVHVAVDGNYVGHIVITDEVKPEAKSALEKLKKAGIEKTVMLTGDIKSVAEQVASDLGIDEVKTDLLPADKVEAFEELMNNKKPNETLIFTGDGINDAPVLSRADVGIAMGAMGSAAAIEAADVVLMDDDLSKISDAVYLAKKTHSIVMQNIIFALAIKGIVLILSALGYVNMWYAVFADVGVSVIAILNAMRTLR